MLIASVDAWTGFPKAIEAVYPHIRTRSSIISSAYVGLVVGLKRCKSLDSLAQTWDHKYP